MKKKLDIDKWVRKDHFNFFKRFDEPFFGVCLEVDCTEAYRVSKESGFSFFLYYLHKSLVAANKTEPFRYRLSEDDDDEVLIYDQVNASPTINRPDGTFGFAYMKYHEEFADFSRDAAIEIEVVQSTTGLIPSISGENIIHYSSLPWLNFSAISHARSYGFNDSIPKIAFGKMREENGKRTMPFSIHVHHALMDGFHVGQFADLFQELMNQE